MQIDQLLWATVAPYTYGTFTSSVLSIYCVTQTVGSVVNRPISCADASNDLEEKADESAEQDQDRWCWELWIKWTGWRVEGHLERGKESFLGCKEINLKGNQPWIFIRRIDDEAEAPILWPPDVKSPLTENPRPWCWERLQAKGEGGSIGWYDQIASLSQWTWIWANSRRQWKTEKLSVL